MGALLGAGKRLITGEPLHDGLHQRRWRRQATGLVAAPYPGRSSRWIKQLGGQLICPKDSFLCAARVRLALPFSGTSASACSAEDSSCRSSKAMACFVHAGGTVHPLDLGPGQTLRVDTGCLVALQPSVGYDIQYVGKIKTALFGGEGLFYAALTGPGRVWLQSLPFSRMADRIYKAAPAAGGSRREGGSVLGGLGDLLDGDPN